MRGAFTLIEILIVVSILGILAALVAPQFGKSAEKAKEAVAKEMLQSLRTRIELYTAQHNGMPPGYLDGNSSGMANGVLAMYQLTTPTNINGDYNAKDPGYDFGPYLNNIPKNPFTDRSWIFQVPSNESLETYPVPNQLGWVYHGQTKSIYLHILGTDSEGVKYLEY